MKKVVLSKRLQAVADMVSLGNRVCDVGCDHGFVSIYLVEQKITEKVIAMDVNPGPLERARKHIQDKNLSGYIETRLSDGIGQLQMDEADTVILAGMGGRLMAEILSADRCKTASLKELILQPQSEIPLFRRFLRESGYTVVEEEILLEEGKFYFLMKTVPGGDTQDKGLSDEVWKTGPDREDRWGRFLLARRHPVLKQYLEKELDNCQQILADVLSVESNTSGKQIKIQSRMQELLAKAEEIEQILKIW